MDIKSISTIALPSAQASQKAQTVSANVQNVQSQNAVSAAKETNKKSFKKLPYVAAGVVLAGLGIYASRKKLAKLFNSQNINKFKNEVKEEVKNEIDDGINFLETKENNEILSTIVSESKNFEESCIKNKIKNVCTGFKNGKPVYRQIEIIPNNKIAPARGRVAEALQSINLNNKKILDKISEVKVQNKEEIKKIINDNTKDGHVDLNIMNKVARDFANDEAGRGADRFHQAAEILEQSLIREFVKGNKKEMTGLQNIFDRATQNSPLFEIYKKMPLEEAASRLKNLSDKDLKSASYKGMDAQTFFDKAFARLIEKIQFQRYNDANGIIVNL